MPNFKGSSIVILCQIITEGEIIVLTGFLGEDNRMEILDKLKKYLTLLKFKIGYEKNSDNDRC